MPITTSSAKNKGRKAQQGVRDAILSTFPTLLADDVVSTPMGVTGADLLLSPAAQDICPYAFEVKARAKWSALEWVDQAIRHAGRSSRSLTPIVVVKPDRRQPHVIVPLDHFMELVAKAQR